MGLHIEIGLSEQGLGWKGKREWEVKDSHVFIQDPGSRVPGQASVITARVRMVMLWCDATRPKARPVRRGHTLVLNFCSFSKNKTWFWVVVHHPRENEASCLTVGTADFFGHMVGSAGWYVPCLGMLFFFLYLFSHSSTQRYFFVFTDSFRHCLFLKSGYILSFSYLATLCPAACWNRKLSIVWIVSHHLFIWFDHIVTELVYISEL